MVGNGVDKPWPDDECLDRLSQSRTLEQSAQQILKAPVGPADATVPSIEIISGTEVLMMMLSDNGSVKSRRRDSVQSST